MAQSFSITPSVGPHGSIGPAVVQTVGWGQSSAPFSFAAAPGYHVADVVVDGVSQGALTTCTFTEVTADLTIAVSFAAVTFTEYRVGGGAWVQGTSVTVGAQGETRVEYRSQDVDGNLEAPAKACMVRSKTWKHVRFSGKHVLRLNTRSLPAGAYTVKLRATDTAGNRQAKPTRVKLVIGK